MTFLCLEVSRHMSTYWAQVTNFKQISSKSIIVVDWHTFEATGKKDVLINILNNTTHMQVVLHDILYVPKMGITLVSVLRLDMAYFAAVMLCQSLHDPDA